MALCIAAGGAVIALAMQAFTIAWTHSIEKVRWEEDYRIEGSMLRLVEARVSGHGAGMEPPPGSRLEHGTWHYTPSLPLLPELRLTHSGYTADYELCSDGRCEALSVHAPKAASGEAVRLYACDIAR